MDWADSELQGAVRDLARQILADQPKSWEAVADAGLLDVDEPEARLTLLVESGRAGGYLPLLETLVLGAPARASVGEATAVLTAALTPVDGRHLPSSSTRQSGGRLTGAWTCVPSLPRASRVVVVADDGLYAVDPTLAEVQAQPGTNGDTTGVLVLDGTPGDQVGSLDDVGPWLQQVHLGICALQLGLAQRALELTAEYARERRQFGVPIGSFQAVRQRAGDAWIDLQAMEVALWRAAWCVAEGEADAWRSVHIARWWASEGGHRVVAAAQHLHGGFGFDRDYPLHRYFLTFKQWEQVLGGASRQLASLGDLLAAS